MMRHGLLLLLLILIQVHSLRVRHLLLVVDLCRDTFMLIVILILEVAREGILHVLALNEIDVHDSKNDENRAQNGQVNCISNPIAMAKQSSNPETRSQNDYKVDIEALAAPLGLFRSQLSTVYFSLAVLRSFYTADCEKTQGIAGDKSWTSVSILEAIPGRHNPSCKTNASCTKRHASVFQFSHICIR